MAEKKTVISGFSKLSQEEKINYLLKFTSSDDSTVFKSFHARDTEFQEIFNHFSENTISNFHLPYGIAPNFLINNKAYLVPMVIEESSVVAAASSAAKFWAENGGFKTRVLDMSKSGQVYFTFTGNEEILIQNFPELKDYFLAETASFTEKMRKRGGGIQNIVLGKTIIDSDVVWKLDVSFLTGDSMGANFINTCLEAIGHALLKSPQMFNNFKEDQFQIIMAILSNYVPECLVECSVSCPVQALSKLSGDFTPQDFAHKFKLATDIASTDVSRATTHNKGIMNGIDAVVIATGNDFRATEAGIHSFAARSGTYTSLTSCSVEKNIFTYTLTVPLAIGTVGGLTKVHKLAAESLRILGSPNAAELMQIIAAAGLANNFSAVSSLITSGIQAGHMKMHLTNILHALDASNKEVAQARIYFKHTSVSYGAVNDFLLNLRARHTQ